jgi:hypothetical protein
VSRQLQECRRLLALEKQLPDVLSGKQPATPAQRLDFAQFCITTRRYATAARLYADAFKAEPRRADDLNGGHRYNAACAAALAAAGKGQDAAKLEAKERTRLRKQALDWLQDDLAAWTNVAAKGSAPTKAAVRRTLEHWQKDSDLAGVRDKTALAKLPKEEQQAWHKLWADVEALLKKVMAAK